MLLCGTIAIDNSSKGISKVMSRVFMSLPFVVVLFFQVVEKRCPFLLDLHFVPFLFNVLVKNSRT